MTLSPGFCASVFADNLGHARHLVISADGVVYVNTWIGSSNQDHDVSTGHFLVALKDTRQNGVADQVVRFGDGVADGSSGGTGIALYHGALYAEQGDKIVRYALPAGAFVPQGPAEVVLSGLPVTGAHPMHPFVIDEHGNLFVDLGSATNACEAMYRMSNSPGRQPCTELETRGGTWLYDANKTDQVFSPAERYATGIRNGEGFAFDASGRLFVTQHGRDQLSQNWPGLYDADQGPELPAEELLQLVRGGDYGWPECYFDGARKKLVLAPEYGGDGGNKVGVCAQKLAPVAFFPAHWAPNDLVIYNGREFPETYRGGAFIAFHGSWNRAPAPQGGYNVVFQPLANGAAAGNYVVFADGFAGAHREPGRAAFRPTGLAVGPDGALYVADDQHGRIWRIVFQGGSGSSTVEAATGPIIETADTAAPPADLPVPPGATKAQVALGDRIYHGEVSGGTCSGCHGSDAKGSPVGPDLTTGTYAWGDGSLASISAVITKGVSEPKAFEGSMPPMGGAKLSPQDIAAVSAYVWAVGHNKH